MCYSPEMPLTPSEYGAMVVMEIGYPRLRPKDFLTPKRSKLKEARLTDPVLRVYLLKLERVLTLMYDGVALKSYDNGRLICMTEEFADLREEVLREILIAMRANNLEFP